MRRTLDPKLDVTFKALLSRPGNGELLVSLINAVLQPSAPIISVTVLNPELPKDLADDKGALLDALVRLSDGRQVDVEMQSCSRPGLRKRALFYWARMYASQIGRGQPHTELEPCVGIFLLNFNELPCTGFHSKFRVIEVSSHEPFSDALELHMVELPKLAECDIKSELDLVHWARFFAAESDDELEELAMQDSTMRKAKEALEVLSADPSARELARQRELGMIGYQLDLQASRSQGIREGETKAMRDSVARLCAVLNIEFDQGKHQQLAAMNATEVETLLDKLTIDRRWPE
jgi:predicted transposase/invertase (TIGR01784 family)